MITLANGKTYETKTEQEKCNAFIEIRSEILKLDQKNLIDELKKMFEIIFMIQKVCYYL